MLRVVADNKIPFLSGVLDKYAEVTLLPGEAISPKDIAKADALIVRTRTKCTRELLKGSAIKFIGTATIGFDHIDTAWCNENGITWRSAPGCNSSSVQQYILAALLSLSQEFRFKLSEKTIGVVGVGNVGSKIAKAASLLGMRVLLNDPPREREEGEGFTSLDTVLSDSDIITLHVPLKVVGQDKTYHLINEKSIRRIKKDAWLLNSSRGEVVDANALKSALIKGKLAGAVLDVWENEPDIDRELMNRCFIATPHIAGYSTDGKANGTAMIINELASFFSLPLSNWYPENIPVPVENVIEINSKTGDSESIIRQAVKASYDIMSDDTRLRFSPSDFEKQRGSYPLRREFSSYSVKLTGGNKGIRNTLKELGFNLI